MTAARPARSLRLAAVAALTAALVAMAAAAAADWDDRARRLKADYLFMQATCVNAIPPEGDGSDGGGRAVEDYYRLLRRAAALNPADLDVQAELGFYECVLSQDSAMTARGNARMKAYVDANPADRYWARLYQGARRRAMDADEVLRIGARLDSLFPDNMELSLAYADDLGGLRGVRGDTAAMSRALAILDRLQAGVGPEPWLVSRKVRLLSAVRDTAGIYAVLDTMLAQAPRSSQSHLFAGTVYAFFEAADSALAQMDRACLLDSANGDAFMARAELYRQIGDSAAYDREVFQALRRGSLELDTKMDVLTNYVRAQWQDTAAAQRARIVDLFQLLIDLHPHQAPLHALYGSYLQLMERLPEAVEQYGYATDVDPSDQDNWKMLLFAQMQQDDWQGVHATATRAAALFPSTALWYLADAGALKDGDRAAEAMDVLGRGLDIVDLDVADRARLLSVRADLHSLAGRYDSAMADYGRAIALDPSNFMSMNNAAYFIAEPRYGGHRPDSASLAQAERWSATTVKSDPSNPTYLDTYAWVLFKQRRYDDARHYIDRALDAYGYGAADSVAVAAADSMPVAQDDGLEDSDMDLAEGPEADAEEDGQSLNAEVLGHAGDIYFMVGELQKALDFWRQALEMDPQDALLRKKVDQKTYFYDLTVEKEDEKPHP